MTEAIFRILNPGSLDIVTAFRFLSCGCCTRISASHVITFTEQTSTALACMQRILGHNEVVGTSGKTKSNNDKSASGTNKVTQVCT